MKKKLFFLLPCAFLASSLLNAAEPPRDGASLFKQCAGCHGKDGQNKAFGRSGIIGGQSAEDLLESLMFFKTSEFTTHSSATVMAKQVKNLSEKDIQELAQFISKLKK